MSPDWQLLVHPHLPASLNMAVDWWLLNNPDVPTFRFYRWSRPTVSLGYRQQENPPDELHDRNLDAVDVVVRPTGGGYLYHEADLSYSIVLPSDHPIADDGIRSSYETICEPFLEAALELDLLDEPDWGSNDGDVPNCLDAPAGHEPTVEGTKWMASAQVRKERAVLQHGSVFWKDSWSEELSASRPHFLSDEAGQVTLPEYRDRVTRTVDRTLFANQTARESTLGEHTWTKIRELEEQFRVNNLGDLPTFRRYR